MKCRAPRALLAIVASVIFSQGLMAANEEDIIG